MDDLKRFDFRDLIETAARIHDQGIPARDHRPLSCTWSREPDSRRLECHWVTDPPAR